MENNIELRVVFARIHEEVNKSIELQIELNKLAEERDQLKKELEEMKEPTQ